MNKENAKILLYKYLPLVLVAANVLTILLFLVGFATIYGANVNVITFFGHLTSLNERLMWSLSDKLALFALSVAFVIALVIMIAFTVKAFLLWRTCALTQVIDFKLEYILKLKNIFSYVMVTAASYVMLAAFLGSMSVSFLAIITFVLAILVITATKFCLYYTGKEELAFSDVIVKTAYQLVYNVIFFGLCLVLAKPAIAMISTAYSHITWLLPSDAYFKAFYNYNLFFELFTGFFCIIFFIITMIEFVLNTKNDLPRKDYRIRAKLAFGLHIVILSLVVVFIGLTFLFSTSAANLGINGAINLIRSIYGPCLLFFVAYFMHIVVAFKKVKDEE